MTGRRITLHAAFVVAITLVARTISYALSPDPAAEALNGTLGGPSVVAVALISLAAAAVVAVTIVFLASVAVRERARLAGAGDRPRLQLAGAARRAIALSVEAAALFVVVESTIHWRAGYGFDPAHCLAGPVHTNAIPVLVALSIIASATIAAGDLLDAWARRTLQAAATTTIRVVPAASEAPIAWSETVAAPARHRGAPPRAPPVAC